MINGRDNWVRPPEAARFDSSMIGKGNEHLLPMRQPRVADMGRAVKCAAIAFPIVLGLLIFILAAGPK